MNLKFEKDTWSYVSMELINVFITFITLGFGTPWVLVRRYKWESEHIKLGEREFKFYGTAIDLFGYWILWWLLTIITFGLYSAVTRMKITEWRVSHTKWKGSGIYE